MSSSRRNKFKAHASQEHPSYRLSPDDAIHLGFPTDGKGPPNAHVVLKYFDGDFECFSEWDKDDLVAFTDFLRKVCCQPWQQIISSGGKGPNKTGLGCTIIPRSRLPAFHERFSPDINFIEMRVTEKARVHGFRIHSGFFLIWLDRNHRICPQ